MERKEKVIEILALLNKKSVFDQDWGSFTTAQLAALLSSDVKELIKDMKTEEKMDD